jgi:AcrR family transcriptional regulator
MADIPADKPRKPHRSWNRRKHARVGEILAAAAQIAAEKGYEKLRMAEVAQRAGVTKGTVYLYFINKDDLIRRVTDWRAPVEIAAEAPATE